jgi:hypothetical protein
MRIIIRRSGGFAGPLLNRTFEFNSEKLPPAEAKKLESLMSHCPLPALHNQRYHARGGADIMKYEVTIESAQGRASFLFDESAVPAEFRPVWELLAKKMEE